MRVRDDLQTVSNTMVQFGESAQLILNDLSPLSASNQQYDADEARAEANDGSQNRSVKCWIDSGIQQGDVSEINKKSEEQGCTYSGAEDRGAVICQVSDELANPVQHVLPVSAR